MRETEASFWIVLETLLTRATRLAVIALGVGLVMAAGPVRAGDDDEEDDRTIEEKIIGNIMAGIGATNMENKGIEYRERSPLVVPPKLDLPPPAGASIEPHVVGGRTERRPDRRSRPHQQRSGGAGRHQQPDPEPVATRLDRQPG